MSACASREGVSGAAGLTELRGGDGDVVPGALLPVQGSEQEHRAVPWVHVEQAVHVSAPVDGVPVRGTQRGERGLSEASGGVTCSNPHVPTYHVIRC